MWLFKNAHFLYANRTPAELALESAIAALGIPYRAQMLFPGLGHIADFALLDSKVIIEVDGKSHDKPIQLAKDYIHTIALAKRGWKVVRCTNEEVLRSPKATLDRLILLATNPQRTPEELLEEAQALGLLDAHGKPTQPKRKPKPRRRGGTRRIARKAVG